MIRPEQQTPRDGLLPMTANSHDICCRDFKSKSKWPMSPYCPLTAHIWRVRFHPSDAYTLTVDLGDVCRQTESTTKTAPQVVRKRHRNGSFLPPSRGRFLLTLAYAVAFSQVQPMAERLSISVPEPYTSPRIRALQNQLATGDHDALDRFWAGGRQGRHAARRSYSE